MYKSKNKLVAFVSIVSALLLFAVMQILDLRFVTRSALLEHGYVTIPYVICGFAFYLNDRKLNLLRCLLVLFLMFPFCYIGLVVYQELLDWLGGAPIGPVMFLPFITLLLLWGLAGLPYHILLNPIKNKSL
ncbi:hypothetical protein MACH26_39220 [Planctobacterium marinum]|uniref:Uncharacterized protein n=1 Tax=Planctobacterium marinum TaxID=1631968 RepID=A0AA48KR27_9ALTE|nr:hypothetical protein MACH26_39220 [Planctobacterium marinum]